MRARGWLVDRWWSNGVRRRVVGGVAGSALRGARSADQTLAIAHPRESGSGYVVD
jgi:hypothetical protein